METIYNLDKERKNMSNVKQRLLIYYYFPYVTSSAIWNAIWRVSGRTIRNDIAEINEILKKIIFKDSFW